MTKLQDTCISVADVSERQYFINYGYHWQPLKTGIAYDEMAVIELPCHESYGHHSDLATKQLEKQNITSVDRW